MKAIINRFVTVIIVLVLVFNQTLPVAAAVSPVVAEVVTPVVLREHAKKPVRVVQYNQPPAPKAAEIAIRLSASPKFITAAGTVTLRWRIENLPAESGALLKISFPAGYLPVVRSGYDPASRSLSIPVSAGSGAFSLNIQTPIADANLPALLLNSSGKTLAETTLALPVHEQFSAKKSGSSLSAEAGRIRVQFAANSLPEDATVNIGPPAGDAVPKHSLSGHPFEIEAQGIASKKDLRQFAEDVTIHVDYSHLSLRPQDESNLTLYYYNPETDDWYALPTSVDPKSKILRASTNHFTVYDTGINDFQVSRLPTLDAFQVASFTGAATYTMPIEVPPGPGGMQPNLSLSYNSQVIDQSSAQTQASWVGMGWSLGMNLIEFNDHGTNPLNVGESYHSAADDTWSINVNGISSTVVVDSHGNYHAADENFMKFERAGDSWTVWDKQGNQYFFEKTVKTVYQRSEGASSHCNYTLPTYQWYLTRMRNTFGKELTYTYTDERKDVAVPVWISGQCSMSERTESLVTATYPETITYPLGHYRVRFERETRPDYRHAWANDVVYRNFQRSRLASIIVEQDETLDGTWELILRKYKFRYALDSDATWAESADGSTNAPVWPGIGWWANGGGKTSTLLQVRQFGLGGVDELPTATFSYADKMHLTRADNGYGGRVLFDYGANEGRDNAFYYTAQAPASKTFAVTFDYGSSSSCWTGGFTPYPNPAANTVSCIHQGNNANLLKLTGQGISTNLLGVGADQLNALRPGGFYRFSFLKHNIGPTDLKYGFRIDNSPDTFALVDDETPVYRMPAHASRADVILKATGSTHESEYVAIDYLKVQLLTAVYRVYQRTIFDGNGHFSTTTYDYGNTGAVNDDAHSASACSDAALNAEPYPTCTQYHEKYSEFRGHAQVIETAPDGHKTITNFHQDDTFKGRTEKVTVKSATGKKLSEQVSHYDSTSLPMVVLRNGVTGLTFNDGDFHNWITTTSEENYIYNNDGSSHATQTSYEYSAYGMYGNLLHKTEKAWNGTSWVDYRATHFAYNPNETATQYLTGLPARQWVTNASGVTLSQTVNIYGANTTWDVPPQSAILTAVRTLVSGSNHAQVSYEYDAWGNRRFTTVYKNYGTASSAPTGEAVTQTTQFDATYRTYPTEQITPPISATQAGFRTRFSEGDPALGKPCTFASLSCTQTDPNGVKTTVTYDSFARLTKVIKHGDSLASPTLEARYNDESRPFSVELRQKVDPTHHYLIRHTYDGLGREILTETGHGDFGFAPTSKVSNEYGLAMSKQSLPYTNTQPTHFTTTLYDALGRPLTVTPPDGQGVSYSYNGLVSTVTDANGHSTTSTSDVWGRTVSVQPAVGPGVQYAYDPLGNLISATRGGLTTSIQYDKAGRKISMNDPDMGTWTYQYDSLGNLTSQTDANQQTTNLIYDGLNRLTRKTYSGSAAEVSYLYDAGANGKGRRTGMSAPGSASTWGYDQRGRVISESKTVAGTTYTTSTTYNNADMPLTMTYPDTETITNHYNDKMQLQQVTSSLGQSYIKNIEYDPTGRVLNRTLGNDLISSYAYYDWTTQGGRLQTLTTSSNLQNLTYNYDDVGNITSIADGISGQTQTYTYDPLDRLTHAEATATLGDSGYNESYTYNALTGNLENKGGITLIYDEVGKTSNHAVRSTSTGNYYGYDANGNQIQRTVDGQTFDLTYDPEGRLLTVSAAPASRQGANPIASPLGTGTPTPTVSTLTLTSLAAEDGYVTESSQTSEQGGSLDSGTGQFFVGDDASNRQMRGILSFDTSALPDNATIQSATLRIKKFSQIGSDPLASSNLRIDIAPAPGKFGSAYTLQNSDFEATSGGDTVAILPSGSQPDANGWFSTNLNASGRTLISPTSKTQLRLRFGTPDDGDNTPDYIKFISADYPAGGTPELIINFTTPNPAATPTGTPPETTPTIQATFTYDADGQMVQSQINGVTTVFVSPVYQIKDNVITKYYPGGAMRVDGTLYYILSDHLGSTSLTIDPAGNKTETKYNPWGQVRQQSGTPLSDRSFTGQRTYTNDFGLMFYNARWYDPTSGRFAQADTIVPGGVQGLDRYAYVNNNPVNNTDPTGHYCVTYLNGNQCVDSDKGSVDTITQSSNAQLTQLTHAGDPIPEFKDKKRAHGGNEIANVFYEYRRTPGWWNNYGKSEFTIQQFLGMWVLMEGNSITKIAGYIATAIAQNLFNGGNNSAVCATSTCSDHFAIFNFMAAYSSGDGSLFKGPSASANVNYYRDRQSYTDEKGFHQGTLDGLDIYSLVSSLGGTALNPAGVKDYTRYNGPSNWRNIKGADDLAGLGITTDSYNQYATAQDAIYYLNPNFVIFSVDQLNYFQTKVDFSMP